ncbi:MAG: MCP four helix bundle domain-containing protein [Burkholderiaceae bacterium]|nr:MCP four helix bundle domain-containing protein [Burkholderiaceae bacterium]
MKLDDIRIGKRLGISFGIVLALVVAMATLGAVELRQLAKADDKLDALALRSQTMEQWKGLTATNLARAMGIAHSGYQAELVAAFAQPMKDTSATISTLQKRLEESLDSDTERALFAAIGEKRNAYVGIRKDAAKLFADGDTDGGRAKVNSAMLPAADAYVAAMDALLAHYQQETDAAAANFDAEQALGLQLLLGFALLAIGCGAAMAVSITRSISVPLQAAARSAEAVATGDLTQRFATGRHDEIGQLLTALQRMQDGLATMVRQIRQSTDSIGTASSEVAVGSQDLSVRTEQTASSLQQTASTMEQITATVRQSTDAAAQAAQLASSASSVAQRGGEVVTQVVRTMDEISGSSKKIADIIGTIDGIAFQTNILALNAAVEAARAGEQGRGFAVVAGEVRQLAQRSAEAAREIKTLINTSVERVEAGGKLVGDAGQTMAEIVSSVQRVTDIIGEVAAAAGEQRSGVSLVNDAVTDLDRMTQQNAALVEESAAAAESLKAQARTLAEAVSVFRVDGAGHHAPVAPAAPATPAVKLATTAPAAPKTAVSAPPPATARATPAPATPAAAKTPAPAPATTADDDWETF